MAVATEVPVGEVLPPQYVLFHDHGAELTVGTGGAEDLEFLQRLQDIQDNAVVGEGDIDGCFAHNPSGRIVNISQPSAPISATSSSSVKIGMGSWDMKSSASSSSNSVGSRIRGCY